MLQQNNEKYEVLLCEDDANLGRALKYVLESNGLSVTLERDGRLGLMAFRKKRFSICLLDVMMPGMDGFQLAAEIRKISPEIPLIFITAKNMKDDVVKGYKLGADDYITKPFDSDVLLMKVKVAIKRGEMTMAATKVEGKIRLGKYTYDTELRDLFFEDKLHTRLSPTEHHLLTLLYQNRGKVLSRDTTLRKIWGADTYLNSRSMDVYITRLRKYLSLDPATSIDNLYSTGFKLVIPEDE